jgi:tRNA nucleotidyltransferase (CCA-adding enzyme)
VRAQLRVHEPFGTATVALHDGPALDLITARHEIYERPGVLPTVVPGTLDEDLRRRDFTINAIALALAPDRLGSLIDPLGGRTDLDARVIRVLHRASFIDDPTRLLRAVRYACRLAFDLAPETAELFRTAIAGRALATVSIQRLSHEFVRLLAETAAAAMLDLLVAFDALGQIAAGLHWDGASHAAYSQLDQLWPLTQGDRGRQFELWTARFAILTAHLAPEAAREVAAALHLTAEAIELADEVARARAEIARVPLPATNSALGHLLDPFATAAVAAVAAITQDEATHARLIHYLATIRLTLPALTGDALKELGVKPGPIYREALGALRDYKRDHADTTGVAEERAFLLRWLEGRGIWPPRPPNSGGSTSVRQ